MVISATKLRQNLYNILDQILETGISVEIERKGKKLKILPEEKISKCNRLAKHNIIIGDPENIVHMDWSNSWDRDNSLSIIL